MSPDELRAGTDITERAVVVCNGKRTGLVLYWHGAGLDELLLHQLVEELEDLGLDDCPDGISVWEGWCNTDEAGEVTQCIGGIFREPTGEEWFDIKRARSPWGPK